MKRLLTILLIAISLNVFAQSTATLPAGAVPYSTQIYRVITVGPPADTAWYTGSAGRSFVKLSGYRDVLRIQDSIASLRNSINGKVNKITGKGLSTEDYTTAEKSKLAGIAAGAEVNVNADWLAVSGDAQILNKPTFVATESDPVFLAQKGAVNGVATLNSSGKIPNTQLPALALVDTYVAASQAAMLALSTAEQGDVAIRTDLSKTFILTDANYSTLASWKELLSPIIPAETDPVWGASASAGITAGNISNWNTKQGSLSGTGMVKSIAGAISYIPESTTATASTIAQRDLNGILFASYFNAPSNLGAGTPSFIVGKFADNYYRDFTGANVAAFVLPGTGMVKSTAGVISYVSENNWNTAYGYSQVGHLPLSAGLSYPLSSFLSINASGDKVIRAVNSLGGDASLYLTGTSTTSNWRFDTYSKSGTFFIQNDGNVGVGTITPTAKMSVIDMLATTTNSLYVEDGSKTTGHTTYFYSNSATSGNVLRVYQDNAAATGAALYVYSDAPKGLYVEKGGVQFGSLIGSVTDMMTIDNLGNVGRQAIPSGAGGGTVGTVGVVSANGFAGTSSGGANPALTLTTTVTGIFKGNGTAISVATAGTDYTTSSSTETFTNKSGNISQWTNNSGYITTSSLSGYAPLSGATFTGPIAGTSATFSGDVTANSDSRLKNNIVHLNSATPALRSLGAYSYNWKHNGAKAIGLIAQELQKYYPELVKADERGILSINYQNFAAVLLAGWKEHDERISKLEQR